MIQVALVDDHPLILRILRQDLTDQPTLHVIWDTTDVRQMLTLLNSQPPQVLVLDLAFAGQGFDPVTAVRDIRARFPKLAILILTSYDDPLWVEEMVEAGVQGYVVKSDDFSLRVAEGIRTVAQGKTFLSPTAVQALATHQQRRTLTIRERAILRLAADGKTNPEIAETLGIAHGTVRNHISNIYTKLGVETREAAIKTAQQLRELPQPNTHLRHELHTPLHTLIGLVRLLQTRLEKNGHLTREDTTEYLQQILAESERLNALIDDILKV